MKKTFAVLFLSMVLCFATACSMEEFDEKTDKIEKSLDKAEEKTTKAIEKASGQSSDNKKSNKKSSKEEKNATNKGEGKEPSEKADAASTSKDNNKNNSVKKEGTKEDPIILNEKNIRDVKVGDYVRVETKYGYLVFSDTGQIVDINGRKNELWMYVGEDKVEANDIKPGEFADVFKQYPPVAFSASETHIEGYDINYGPCYWVVEGYVKKRIISDEASDYGWDPFIGIELRDSVIKDVKVDKR